MEQNKGKKGKDDGDDVDDDEDVDKKKLFSCPHRRRQIQHMYSESYLYLHQ